MNTTRPSPLNWPGPSPRARRRACRWASRRRLFISTRWPGRRRLAVLLGAQDVYFEKNGAFTGEISVEMLKDLGVKFVPRRPQRAAARLRRVVGELVAQKGRRRFTPAGLTLVHCVGEKLEQRDAGPDVRRGAAAARGTDRRDAGPASGWSSPTSRSGRSAPGATRPTRRPRKCMLTFARHLARCGTRISPTACGFNTAAA